METSTVAGLDLQPGPATRVARLLAPGGDGRLGAVRVDGPVRGRTAGAVAWILVEGGRGRLCAGDAVVDVAGRTDVFDRPGWSAIIGPRAGYALEGDVRATIVWREESRDLPTRVVAPDDVTDELRGEGATARRVRTYVAEGPLIVGETLNPPGGWSSYPPHRHEHEEIYLYRFDPPEGFGLQMRSQSDDDERAVVVRDGRIERITSGWHPVVAAPGFTMYYLWALAGADVLETETDTRYAP
ncbi:MAG TPA: 5-deoxy-glucuronate isomerase [Acidimicrobiia bacterium]